LPEAAEVVVGRALGEGQGQRAVTLQGAR